MEIVLAAIAVLLAIILNIYYRQPVPDELPRSEERALRMYGVLVTIIWKMVSESANFVIFSLCFPFVLKSCLLHCVYKRIISVDSYSARSLLLYF